MPSHGIAATHAPAESVPLEICSLLIHRVHMARYPNQPPAEARQLAMYLAHVSCSLPMTHVGAVFGRDRATVRYACHKIEDFRSIISFERTLCRLETAAAALLVSLDGPTVAAWNNPPNIPPANSLRR